MPKRTKRTSLLSDKEFDLYAKAVAAAIANVRPEGINGNDLCSVLAGALGKLLATIPATEREGSLIQVIDLIRERARFCQMPYSSHVGEDGYGEGECTCRQTGLGPNDPDAGWRLDKWCPVHGKDPDDALDEMRERQHDDISGGGIDQ